MSCKWKQQQQQKQWMDNIIFTAMKSVETAKNVCFFYTFWISFFGLLKRQAWLWTAKTMLVLLVEKSAGFSKPTKFVSSGVFCKFSEFFKTYFLYYTYHIVRLAIWHHLFLDSWLVSTWFFATWRHQRVVTRLENVCQLDIRRSKKLDFQLSHRKPPMDDCFWIFFQWTKLKRDSSSCDFLRILQIWFFFTVNEFKKRL